MRTSMTALSVTLATLSGAPVLAAGSDTAIARATDRAPQQVAALVRGVAAGNGWTLAEEVTFRGGEVIGMQLCQEAGEEKTLLCGQFAILGSSSTTEIILLDVGTMLPTEAVDPARIIDFPGVLNAVAPPAIARAERRFGCDASGCP